MDWELVTLPNGSRQLVAADDGCFVLAGPKCGVSPEGLDTKWVSPALVEWMYENRHRLKKPEAV